MGALSSRQNAVEEEVDSLPLHAIYRYPPKSGKPFKGSKTSTRSYFLGMSYFRGNRVGIWYRSGMVYIRYIPGIGKLGLSFKVFWTPGSG
uniref:Uncharacterized protein n=1 Tax=Anolis carolinensis TaxID=28377 RepID=A0A803TL18_ANOCA